ncbi:MAG: hypothetical protein M3Q47_06535 [Actinomycetota bacterium]|nr:hypothetical protein [Actinomycetota bacterium]
MPAAGGDLGRGLRPASRRDPVPTPSLPVPPAPAIVRTVAPRTPAVTFVGNRVVDVPQTQEISPR